MRNILHTVASSSCKALSFNPRSLAFKIISSLAKSTSIMIFSLLTHFVNTVLNTTQEAR